MGSNAEEFRKRADECYRLSVRVKDPEHKCLALYLAAAWLELAQRDERQQAAPALDVPTITTPPADPRPKDQIE